MSVRKKWMVFLMVLCIAVTIASVASLTVPVAAKEPSGPVYVRRDNSGRLALYDAENGSLLRQYDVYTHLLPANKKHSKAPGDDKGMAEARRRFLSGGYYGHLLAALCALGAEYAPPGEAVLDSGCGEGYYTAGLWEALGRPPLAGIDLSKPSVRLAARRVPEGEFAVASAYHLPLADASVGLVLNCFSPLALDEFRRVLRPGGAFLYVVPAADHLWELKQVLYDQPYRNREEDVPYEGFSYERVEPVEAVVDVAGEALRDLFQMTPYYWKTPREGAERLAALDGLRVRASFRVHVFRRR